MELVVNDLSLHGQYSDPGQLQAALNRILQIRVIAGRFGRSLLCHREVSHRPVIGSQSMREVAGVLPINVRRALLSWLDKLGPFWEDDRAHDEDQWLEHGNRIVTGHALAEAAFRVAHGLQRAIVSFTPSDYDRSPVAVDWVRGQTERETVEVANFWDPAKVEAALAAAEPMVASWSQLEGRARSRFPDISFSVDAFAPLSGHPFVQSAADRFLVLFDILQRLKRAHDADGRRTPEGQALYEDHFMREKAAFSDSSDSEKVDFASDMTFPHPDGAGRKMFCPFHGKVKTPQLRSHFSWPIQKDQPVYLVYVGPKITKR